MPESGCDWVWYDGDVRGRSRARAPRDGFTAGPVMPYPIATRHFSHADDPIQKSDFSNLVPRCDLVP